MTTASTVTIQTDSPNGGPRAAASRRAYAVPYHTLALTLLLIALVAIPRVAANTRLVWSIVGVGGAMLVWQLALWLRARSRGRAFAIEFVPVKAHYMQALVQLGILAWWALYAPEVRTAAPLILAQILFLYVLDALLSWSRGWNWRLGFGPLPIIFSTNLLLWFRDDWFFMQFLMVALGAIGKQFIQWRHEGRSRHIFNPSSFGQALFAVGLIVLGLTNDLTWGKEIASSFEVPHMLVVIFLLGLIVQYQFHVTLMTLSAAVVLILTNLVYTSVTGTYFFVTINIAAPIFLGIHLLITDPSTSPRTNMGRILFGGLYGLGYVALFRIFDDYNVPLFWDKLLPVPILNLMVPLFDWFARKGPLGRVNRWWEAALRPHRMNLVHMGMWITIFVSMLATGFIEAPHEGNSIPFWKQAFAEGKPHAAHGLVMAAGSLAEGAGQATAYNELGTICADGLRESDQSVVYRNPQKAAEFFAKACQMGDINGCLNEAIQAICRREKLSDEQVSFAIDRLEGACNSDGDLMSCYLVGRAYEIGEGRPADPRQAMRYYEHCGPIPVACKGLARIALADNGVTYDLRRIAAILNRAMKKGDARSAWYLAYMYHQGAGLPQSDGKARRLLQLARKLGLPEAFGDGAQDEIPPYTNPPLAQLPWVTAYPLAASK